jgi:hypothetical protein
MKYEQPTAGLNRARPSRPLPGGEDSHSQLETEPKGARCRSWGGDHLLASSKDTTPCTAIRALACTSMSGSISFGVWALAVPVLPRQWRF